MPQYSANQAAGADPSAILYDLPHSKPRGDIMLRYAVIAAALIVLMPTSRCFAVDAKQKMATCKFGADDQKLQGAARAAFLKKCMANRNDPRGPGASGAMAAPKQ